jgi:hypothetical protein
MENIYFSTLLKLKIGKRLSDADKPRVEGFESGLISLHKVSLEIIRSRFFQNGSEDENFFQSCCLTKLAFFLFVEFLKDWLSFKHALMIVIFLLVAETHVAMPNKCDCAFIK